jgi:hypothetical protein
MQFDALAKTIISQYATSPTFLQLIQDINTWIDPNANLQAFFNDLWNIDTAFGYGLDVWGRIIVVQRTVVLPDGSKYTLPDSTYRLLLLAKAATNITSCAIPAINRIMLALFPNRGNCYVQEGAPMLPPVGPWFGFAEAGDARGWDQAPFLLFWTNTPAPGMALTYVFEFALSDVELAIVTQTGALPKPAGVKAYVTAPGVQLGI